MLDRGQLGLVESRRAKRTCATWCHGGPAQSLGSRDSLVHQVAIGDLVDHPEFQCSLGANKFASRDPACGLRNSDQPRQPLGSARTRNESHFHFR